MKKKKKEIVASGLSLVLLLAPMISLAYNFDPGSPPATVNFSITDIVGIILGILWPIAVAFFIIMFVIAGFKYATALGDPGKVGDANKFVIWGLAGVAVALLAFSVVLFIRTRLGV